MNRGLTVPETMKLTLAAKGKEATEEQILQASVVGWCIEWLQVHTAFSECGTGIECVQL